MMFDRHCHAKPGVSKQGAGNPARPCNGPTNTQVQVSVGQFSEQFIGVTLMRQGGHFCLNVVCLMEPGGDFFSGDSGSVSDAQSLSFATPDAAGTLQCSASHPVEYSGIVDKCLAGR